MFVVRRAFRTKGGPVSAGSVVEPADVQNFKYRIGEKHIVEVTEHNYKRYASFFKERFGVDIPDPATFLNKEQLATKEAEAKAAAEAPAKEAEAKAAAEAPAKETQKEPEKIAPVKTVAKAVSTK
jgi:hypothetical protein